MASLTLALTGSAKLSYRYPSTNISGESSISTCCYFLMSTREGDKNNLQNSSYYKSDICAAFLEFASNAILKYKKINRVLLHYRIYRDFTGTYPNYFYLRENSDAITVYECLAPYIGNYTSANITKQNIATPSTISKRTINLINEVPKAVTYYDRTADITDIYKSNFAGESSAFILSTGAETISFESHPDNVIGAGFIAERQTDQSSAYNGYHIDTSTVYLSVDYDDVTQPAPTPTYPCNVTLQENTAIQFSWLFNSSTAAGQQSATIQYKLASDNAWTTVTSAGSGKTYTLAAGLPQGSYEWRAAVTNILNETSNYSATQTFNVIGKPASPVIETPANCCLTTIQWNATGQEAAEIMFYQNDKLIAHETLATTITEYKPQMFLKGEYSISVRIKNNADLWSDFGSLTFAIDAAGAGKGSLNMLPFDKYVELIGTVSTQNSAIIRKEKDKETVIAMNSEAIDDTVAGGIEYEYIVRTWNTGGYTDSDPKRVKFNIEGSIIKSENYELNFKHSEEKFLIHDETISRNMSINNFIGREYPVIERGEFTTRTISKRFHVNREQKQILDEMSKEPAVFYRDNRGNAFKAVITQLRYTEYMTDDYIAEITLLKTAPNEVIINV